MKESKSYGEFTVFFDFFKKFTSKDETNLELLESTFDGHLKEIQEYQAQLENFKEFMTYDNLEKNKQIYFRTKLNYLAKTIK